MRQNRILIVDDEVSVRTLLRDFLRTRGFETLGAANSEEALEVLNREPVQLVLSDVNMPGRNGISLLTEIRRRHPAVGVLMLTGCEDVSLAVQSMKAGAHDYLLKPFLLPKVEECVREALHRQSALQDAASRLRLLEETVQSQTQEVRSLLGRLNEASEDTLHALVTALDAREHETKSHSRRVAEYSVRIAEEMRIEGEALSDIRRGAMLHDIGKIGVSDRVLLKPGSLTEPEWEEMRRHPEIGSWILEGVAGLRGAAQVLLSHHERFDGSGYPYGLQGAEIPLGARIFAVADSLDAMTSDRPYHRGHSFEAAREEIAASAGEQFDPRVVESFLKIDTQTWAQIRALTLSDGESRSSPARQPGRSWRANNS